MEHCCCWIWWFRRGNGAVLDTCERTLYFIHSRRATSIVIQAYSWNVVRVIKIRAKVCAFTHLIVIKLTCFVKAMRHARLLQSRSEIPIRTISNTHFGCIVFYFKEWTILMTFSRVLITKVGAGAYRFTCTVILIDVMKWTEIWEITERTIYFNVLIARLLALSC